MAGDRKLRIVIDGDATGAVEATDRLGGKLSSFAKGATVALGGAALGFASLGKASVDAASNMAETQSKVAVIFGDQAKAIEAFSSNAAKAFGQSKQQAMDAAAGFATFGKAAGLQGAGLTDFSTKLTGLASDMASFSNTSPEDAIEALGAALRGESEPIRRYGVMLDDATLKNAALKMGIYNGKGALDAKSKSLAAYQAILDQTKDAQGDFARTSDGLANKQRIMAAQIEDLKVKMGQALLPVVLTVTSAFANLVTKLTPIAQHIAEKLGPVLEKVVGFIKDNAAPIIGALAVVLGGVFIAALAGAVQAVIAFNVALAANPIALVVLALAGLVAGVIYAYQRFETFRDVVDGVGRFLRDTVLPIMLGFVTTVREGFGQLAGLLNPLWEPIKEAWSTVWSLFAGIFTGHWDVARETAVAALGTVAGWITDIVEGVKGVWSGMWDSLKDAFGDDGPWGVVRGVAVEGLATVKEWVGGIQTEVGGAWSGVWDFLRGLFDLAWSGVKSTVGGGIGSVWEWVQGIGGAVSTAWSGVWEALSAPFLLAWDGIKEIVQPAIDGLATAFGAISLAVEALIGWLGRISWPEPPDWMKSIIGAGGDIVGGLSNWLQNGGPLGGGGASASPGASRGGSTVTAPAGPAASSAPAGMKPGETWTDTNNKTWVMGPGGALSPAGSPGDGDTNQPAASSSAGAGSGASARPVSPSPFAGADANSPSAPAPAPAADTDVNGFVGAPTPKPTPATSAPTIPTDQPAPGGAIAKGKAAGFIPSVVGYAQAASGKTGIPTSLIIAQWAIETQWGEDHKAHPPYSNLAGIGGLGKYVKYKSINDFITVGYAPLMNSKYPMVASAAKASGVKAACVALGKSPWAEHHYRADATGTEGQFAGSSGTEGLALWNVIKSNNLTQYDSGGTPPDAAGESEYSSPSSADVGPAMYPTPDAVGTSAWGDPDKWRSGIVSASAPGGTSFSIQSKLKGRFEGFLGDWVARGGKLNPSGNGYTVGSYNVRKIDNSSRWSNHSFGAAIDINEKTNPYQSPLVTDMYPPAARAMAKKWGLRWGGGYSGKKDPMHFEFAGAPAAMATGGRVPGYGIGDIVPAMLTPGEWVIRQPAAAALGAGALTALNNADRGGVLGPSAREIGAEVARALMAAGAARPITFIDATRSRGDGVSPAARIRQIELLVGAGL